MAAKDAKTVLESGLPITLLPINCTQQLALTDERADKIRSLFIKEPEKGEKIIKMMSAPAEFDRRKFNSPPFMHDVNVALMLTNPELYETKQGNISVSTNDAEKGRSDFNESQNGNISLATKLKDSDMAFDIFLNTLKSLVALKNNRGWSRNGGGI